MKKITLIIAALLLFILPFKTFGNNGSIFWITIYRTIDGVVEQENIDPTQGGVPEIEMDEDGDLEILVWADGNSPYYYAVFGHSTGYFDDITINGSEYTFLLSDNNQREQRYTVWVDDDEFDFKMIEQSNGTNSIYWITIFYTLNGEPEQFNIDPSNGGVPEIEMDEDGDLEILVWADGNSPYYYAVFGHSTGYFDDITKNGSEHTFLLSDNNQRGQRYTVWVDDDELDFKMIEQSTNYTITTTSSPANGGSTSGGGTFQQGEQCCVEATANPNWTFSHWEENGTTVPGGNLFCFDVTEDRNLVAIFNPIEFSINTSSSPTNGGSTSGGGTFQQGSECCVEAIENTDWTFSHWEENGTTVPGGNSFCFDVTANRNLVAIFSPIEFSINTSSSPANGGTTSGGGIFQQGSECCVEAIENTDWTFSHWEENGTTVPGGNSFCFNVTEDRNLTAVFELNGCPPPEDWIVNPATYSYNGEINAQVFIDELAVEAGTLAAFVNDECLGVAEAVYFPPADHYVFTLLCYSNQATGEILSFKYFDPIECEVMDIYESVEFEADMITGTAMNPTELNIGGPITISIELSSGNNYFSINVIAEDMSFDNVLSSLVLTEGDYIKNNYNSATYYEETGWFGSLTEINPIEMYHIKLTIGDTLVFTGLPVDIANTPIPLNEGWTWIGYLPQNSCDIETALGGLNLNQEDYIKNIESSSTYYDDFGWFGNLTTLEPHNGYKVKLANPDILTYPVNCENAKKSAFVPTTIINESTKPNKPETDEVPEWTVDPSGFAYNGEVVGKVLYNSLPAESGTLAAFVDGECRGVANATFFPPGNHYVFILMCYSNAASGENLEFKYYNPGTDQIVEIEESVEFMADMIEGSALNPVIFNTATPSLMADFTAETTSGFTPLTVHFTDISQGNLTSWQWDFDNDGTIDAEEPNPNWTYIEEGLFTVCLTVSNGIDTTTGCKPDYIDVQPFASNVCTNLRLTNSKYPETDDLSQKVTEEFGSNYMVADWLDLLELSDIESWISCMNLTDGDRFMLTRNGEYIYNSNRQYFVAYLLDGTVPGGWLVHDQIADKLFLGSWYSLNCRILAKNTNPSQGISTIFISDESGNSNLWKGILQDGEMTNKEMLTSFVDGLIINFDASDATQRIVINHRMEGSVENEWLLYDYNGTLINEIIPPVDLVQSSYISFSPNGDSIVFSNGTNASYGYADLIAAKCNIDGTGYKVIADINEPRGYATHKNYFNWFEEGILFGDTKQWSTFSTKHEVFLLQDDVFTNLTNTGSNGETSPVLSPMNDSIVFLTLNNGTGQGLSKMSFLGGNQEVIFPQSNLDRYTVTEWLPDNIILYSYGNSDGNYKHDIFSMKSNGTEIVNITKSSNFSEYKIKVINAEPQSLSANFSANKTEGSTPLTVDFTDLSAGEPTSWQWDFDSDGTVDSEVQNPTWVYESSGLYDVTLIAAWDGFFDTLTKTEYITVINPEPIIVEVLTDKEAYYQDETIEISITAQNNTDSTITLEFSNSCQSSYLIDGIEYDRGYPNGYFLCTMAFEYLDIPANSTYTWVHNHSLVIAPLGLGFHQLVGNVDTYPNNITSNSISFEVLPPIALPTVTTTQASEITKTSALSGGDVSDDGVAEITARGVCWNTSGTPTINDSYTEDGTGTGEYISNITGLSCNTNYYVRAYATNSVGTAYGEEIEFTTLPCGETYFETVWTTPFSPMNIYVTEATIDELNMVAGDEIGVFDVDSESGNDICVGAGILVEELANGAYLSIIASMDDGIDQTNGFQPGNEMIFKLHSQSIGLVELVSVTFPYSGYDEVFAPLGTATVELNGVTVVTQTLEFVEGWNLSSMRTLPEDMNMLSIVNPLIEAEVLVKVINQDGGSVEHLPFPPPNGQWSNTIGDWVIEQGYYVNVNENTSLTITAPPVEIPMEIPLRAGWNMTGMPCEYPQSTEAILQPLINAGILVKAINDQGQAIEHLPFPPPAGQWVYGFEAFEPGEGYYIKANAVSSLDFDCMSLYEGDAITQKTQLQFFEPVYKNNPYMPMNVVLTEIDNLAMGDEIAIYDNGVCVGAAVIEHFDFVSIPVSMDDPLTEEIDGYTSGNIPSVSIWQNESNAIFEGEIQFISGVETFQPLETFVGELNVLLTEIVALTSENLLFKIAPNPFSTSTWLNYTLPESGDITIRIYNMAGQQEVVLNNQQVPAGNGKISIDGSSLIPGSYIMQISYSNQKGISTANKKLFIK